MRGRALIALAGLAGSAVPAVAQPATDRLTLPRDARRLDIDDCGTPGAGLSQEELRRRGGEHYDRGATLYVQGDYRGAIKEFVASYCLIPFYSLLKDIGQAYERALDYEKAIGYLARYVDKMPADAKPANACAPDPQVDRENVRQRITVLAGLRGQLLVESVPADAKITLSRGGRVAGRATSGEPIELEGGVYDMVVAREGFETVTRTIELKIGKPLTNFIQLQEQMGSLVVQTSPSDARVFLDDRFVGIGQTEQKLKGGTYIVMAEAPGRLSYQRRVEVLPDRVNRVQLDLAPQPQFGRRQLIAFSTIGGGIVAGNLLAAFDDAGIGLLGGIGGVVVGGLGSYLFLPDTVPLGTSNLTITTAVAAGFAGSSGAALFSERNEVIQPIGAVAAIGGTLLGYYIGSRTRIRPGDAALINSSILWGTTAGALFAASFEADNQIGGGLVASGLALGVASGALMANYYDISRTHAALIDLGGVIGIFGGVALVGFLYPTEDNTRDTEHLANYALGGMAVGLLGAGILTRNLDAPKIPVAPTMQRVPTADGTSTTTFGFGARF